MRGHNIVCANEWLCAWPLFSVAVDEWGLALNLFHLGVFILCIFAFFDIIVRLRMSRT